MIPRGTADTIRAMSTPSGPSEPASAAPGARRVDVYVSVDVETDGPIPGPYSMLSFALVPAGRFDGVRYTRADVAAPSFYAELRPISETFEPEALAVSGLDRDALRLRGRDPAEAMAEAARFVEALAGDATPVLVAYPLGFDWSFLHWYFVRFVGRSPFGHSQAFDLKTAAAVTLRRPIAASGRTRLPAWLQAEAPHTHHALDDARAQAEIVRALMEREGGGHAR